MKIGELFIALGFDVDDKKLKQFNEDLKTGLEGMLKLSVAATAAVGALAAFVQHAADSAVKLSNMRADFGASTQAAQTFANALHQINPAVGVDEALEKYRKFSELVRASVVQGRGGEATGALARLGVNWHEGITPEEARQDIARNKSKTLGQLSSDPATAKAIYAELLGSIGLGGSTRLFDENESEYQRSSRFNVSDDQIKNLEDFAHATAKLSEATNKFANDLASELAVHLTPAVEAFVSALESIEKFNSEHKGAALAEGAAGVGLLGILGRAGSKIPYIGGASAFAGNLGILAALGSIPWVASDIGTGIGEYIKSHRAGGNYFERMGWSKAQSAGIMRRLMAESAMNPNVTGDGGLAYGIAQWHPDRQENFKRFSGHDIRGSSIDEQLAFVQYELTKGLERSAGDKVKKARTEDEAYAAFTKYYERSASASKIDISIHSNQDPKMIADEVDKRLQQRLNSAYGQTNLGAPY